MTAPPSSSSPGEQLAPGSTYEVPVEGSLALLALGARGIEAWREKRAEVEHQRAASQPDADSEIADG